MNPAKTRLQADIDAQIVAQTQVLQRLKTRRNELAAIAMLPDELLGQIFLLCLPRRRTHDTERAGGARPERHWYLTHVCRRFRAVLLAMPVFWSVIVNPTRGWAPTALERSQDVPLTVRMTLAEERPAGVDAVLDQLYRIKTLELKGFGRHLDDVLTRPAAEASELESLRLRYAPPPGSVEAYFAPNDTFLGETPALRHLELCSCSFEWSSPRYNTLTHLELHHFVPAQRPILFDFLDLLERAQQLATLVLVNAAPPVFFAGTTAVLHPPRTVTLPRLRSLSLSDFAMEIWQLLDRLILPETPVPQVKCFVYLGRAGGMSFLESQLLTLLPTVAERCCAARPFKQLLLRSQAYGVHIRGWTDAPSHHEGAGGWLPAADASLDLTFVSDAWYNGAQPVADLHAVADAWRGAEELAVSTVALVACRLLPLHRLRRLTLHDMDVVGRVAWPQVLGHVSRIHSLHLCGRPPYGLVAALCGEKGGAEPVLLPSLRRVSLQLMDFGTRACNVGGEPFLDALSGCLAVRKEKGKALKYLRFEVCENVKPAQVKRLGEATTVLKEDRPSF